MGGGFSVGGTAPTYSALKMFPMPSSGTPAPASVPFAQPDVSSAVSVLEDSLSDPSAPTPTTPPIVTIKDKAAELGLKDIVDKAS